MSAYEITPQIVRSRRNLERNGQPNAEVFELETSINQQKSPAVVQDDPVLHGSLATLALVPPKEYFGYFSTSALILNKMFGTGIFVTPALILALTNSKSTSIILWLWGSLVTWAGLAVYLEYGIRFPLNGGELHYIDYVWTRPKMLLTYVYSLVFVIISGSQGNALTFGKAVIIASTPAGAHIDTRLQKFFAILVIGFICQIQAFSRVNYVRFNNLFAIYKIILLTFLTITGWCALGGQRALDAAKADGPYGLQNLRPDFDQTVFHPYSFAIALLSIMRVFLGYENANFVLEEVKRRPGDESRVYRRAAKITMLMVTFFYIMINVAFFAACDTEELISGSDTLSLFFTKVFGPSPKARRASGVIQAISAFGNMMSYIYSNVRVKQEIARLGIIPYPEFWARTNRYGAPGNAFLLTFICTTVMLIASPLSDANGFLIISTLFTYARTWIAIILGTGLLAARRLDSFKYNGKNWRPAGVRGGSKVLTPLILLFVSANLFVLVFSWWPADVHKSLQTKSPILPSITGPIVSTALLAAGALYWLWDLQLLRWFGYTWSVAESEPEDGEVKMLVTRNFDRQALDIFILYQKCKVKFTGFVTSVKEQWRRVVHHF